MKEFRYIRHCDMDEILENKADKLLERANKTENENEKLVCLKKLDELIAKGIKPNVYSNIIDVYVYEMNYDNSNSKRYTKSKKEKLIDEALKEMFPVTILKNQSNYKRKRGSKRGKWEVRTYLYTNYKEIIHHVDIIMKYLSQISKFKSEAYIESFLFGISEKYAQNHNITSLSKTVLFDVDFKTNNIYLTKNEFDEDAYLQGKDFVSHGNMLGNKKLLY